jgi:probable HAF family extracellular repeat protein
MIAKHATHLTGIGLLISLSVVFSLAAPETTLAQGTYKISDLGTLGGDNSVPYWITNTGDVIGISDTGQSDNGTPPAPIQHAFRWSKGEMHDLGTLGDVNSVGLGGNDKGAAVGNNYYNINHALLWYNGSVADLGTLVGPSGYSWAQQINNAAQVVGGSAAVDGTFHAVLWNRGVISDLGTLGAPGSSLFSLANGVNDKGQIVGDSQENDVVNPLLGFPPFFPTIWNQGLATKLVGQPSYTVGGDGYNINNKGQVVGRLAVADPIEGLVSHGYFWQAGVMQDLGVPFGDDNSEALSLNDNGDVVGDSGVGFIFGYTPNHALLWRSGEWIDLNTLIRPNSGYYLIKALAVNARGEIVVCAVNVNTGNVHAALLSPQPSNMTSGNSNDRHDAAPRLSTSAERLLRMVRSRPGTKP